jgi:hypothetical protein
MEDPPITSSDSTLRIMFYSSGSQPHRLICVYPGSKVHAELLWMLRIEQKTDFQDYLFVRHSTDQFTFLY